MPIHDWTRVDAGLFHDFRQSWMIYINDALNAGLLPNDLSALVERKGKLVDPDSPQGDDLANCIVVKHLLKQTVAVIEIMSPGDKDSERAFKQFIDHCREFLRAGIHLLVVDLFAPTRRDPFGVHRVIWDEFEEDHVLFEFPPGKDRILASYHAGQEKTAYVEPITVGDVLPDMPLFLLQDRYIKVPLEAAYQLAWSVLPRDLQVIVETGVMPAPEDDS